MAKKNTNMFVIVGAIAILIIFTQTPILDNLTPDPNAPNVPKLKPDAGTNPENDLVSVRCYDINRNQVDCDTGNRLFSIVGGTPEIYFIDLTVTLTSAGMRTLSCDIINLSPTAFDSAITRSTKTVPIEGNAAWVSDLIDVAQFESLPQPTIFLATAECSYTSVGVITTLAQKTGTLPLTIEPDESGAGGFDIGITGVEPTDPPTEFCGDNICQVNEDPDTCPTDCAVSSGVVIFRTNALSRGDFITPESGTIWLVIDRGSGLEGYARISDRSDYCRRSLGERLGETQFGQEIRSFGSGLVVCIEPGDTGYNELWDSRVYTNNYGFFDLVLEFSTSPTEPYASNGQELYE